MFYTLENIHSTIAKLRNNGKIIILATGFFDLLHAEHIKFLRKARHAGDTLVVAVESDERARALKGVGRPIEPQAVRCKKVGSYADYVITLNSDFNNPSAYESLLVAVQPDFLAVSSHSDHLDNKKTLIEKCGGKLLIVHDWNPEVSTTKIITQQKT